MKLNKTMMRTMIRKIVREEVAVAIHEVITELKQPIQQVSKPKQKRKIVEKQQNYTKNSILNDVLNETAMGDDWKSISSNSADKTLNSISSTLSNSYGDVLGDESINVEQMASEEGVNPEIVPDHIEKALTRDYTELMSEINKKKGDK